MNDLAELYRQAPRVASPESVDRMVLAHAQQHAPEPAARWWQQYWVPAFSMVLVGVIGAAMLLRNGAPPMSDTGVGSIAQAPAVLEDEELAEEKQLPMAAEISVADAENSGIVSEPETAVASRSAKQRIAADSRLMADEVPTEALAPPVEPAAELQSTEQRQSVGIGRMWVMEQPETYYTVRTRAETDIRKLAQSHSEHPALAGARPVRLDENHWTLLSGSFATRAAAEQLAGKLPADLESEVVSFAELKSVLR